MTFEQKTAVILDKSDAESRDAFEYFVDMYYEKARRLKVKMPMLPLLVAAPRGVQARRARPDNGQSQEQKQKRAKLTVIRGGRLANRQHPGASGVRI